MSLLISPFFKVKYAIYLLKNSEEKCIFVQKGGLDLIKKKWSRISPFLLIINLNFPFFSGIEEIASNVRKLFSYACISSEKVPNEGHNQMVRREFITKLNTLTPLYYSYL